MRRNWSTAAPVLMACAMVVGGCSSSASSDAPSGGQVDDAGVDAPASPTRDGSASADGASASDGDVQDVRAPMDAQGATDAHDAGPARPLPALPLHTSSRWIVDANGKRFKLAAANWYGAEEDTYVPFGLDKQPIASIAKLIADYGFNAVRLPWSNEMVETNKVVADAAVAANPGLKGHHALEVLDAVIAGLAYQGIVVILDNHMSNAGWCCSDTDGNTLWYNAAYPESSWLADWKTMVGRYVHQPAVVAADLRNELRGSVTWGSGDTTTDWRIAAKKGGDAVLAANPNLLIMVEGLGYSLDFTGIYNQMDDVDTFFSVDHRLVWAPHDYAWDHKDIVSYDGTEPALKTELGNKWGFLLVQGKPYTAPVWVGEFGTCNTDATCVSYTDNSKGGFWFQGFRSYLSGADIDWSYWPWNGTGPKGAAETYGILTPNWDGPSLPALLSALQAIQPATQGP